MWSVLIAGYGAAPLYDYATYSLGLSVPEPCFCASLMFS